MESPPNHSKAGAPDELIAGGMPETRIYLQMLRLKRQFRRGWLRAGVSPQLCESVADHAWGCAMLCLLLAPDAGLDAGHCALLALVHELGEIHAGDITPHDGIPKSEKHQLEVAAIERLLASPDSVGATSTKLPKSLEYIRALWQEYEAGTSPEARFVKGIDRLEMGYQAVVYQAEGHGDMSDFTKTARLTIGQSGLAKLSGDLQP